jgi:hypothetical protein
MPTAVPLPCTPAGVRPAQPTVAPLMRRLVRLIAPLVFLR